jgi:hypothetical protein
MCSSNPILRATLAKLALQPMEDINLLPTPGMHKVSHFLRSYELRGLEYVPLDWKVGYQSRMMLVCRTESPIIARLLLESGR